MYFDKTHFNMINSELLELHIVIFQCGSGQDLGSGWLITAQNTKAGYITNETVSSWRQFLRNPSSEQYFMFYGLTSRFNSLRIKIYFYDLNHRLDWGSENADVICLGVVLDRERERAVYYVVCFCQHCSSSRSSIITSSTVPALTLRCSEIKTRHR